MVCPLHFRAKEILTKTAVGIVEASRKADFEVIKIHARAYSSTNTGHLKLQEKTELIGNEEEGYIVVWLRSNWRANAFE